MMMNPMLSVFPFLCPFLVVSSFCQLAGPVRGAIDSELEGKVESYIKSLRGRGVLRGDERTAWLVYDFTSGKKLVSINENTTLQAASKTVQGQGLAFIKGKLAFLGRASGVRARRRLQPGADGIDELIERKWIRQAMKRRSR